MESCKNRKFDFIERGSCSWTFVMFTSSTSPGKWQISFAVMCVATSLAYKSIIIPFYVGYVFVAIFIVFEMTVEFC